MDIHVYSKNQRYHFVAGSFVSERDYYLFPGIKSNYAKAWMAEYAARKLLKKPLILSQVSADQEANSPESDSSSMLRNHYSGACEDIQKSAELTKDDKDKREQVYGTLKMLVENILKIKASMDDEKDVGFFNQLINKLSSLAKKYFADLLDKDAAQSESPAPEVAPSPPAGMPGAMPPLGAKSVAIVRSALAKRNLDLDAKDLGELMEHYATQACHAIENRYPDTIYVLYPENHTILLCNIHNDKPFLRLALNKDYLVNLIAPQADSLWADSKQFYQHCWRPIVETIGHFACGDAVIVNGITSLPDASDTRSEHPVLCASSNGKVLRAIAFSDRSWYIKHAQKTVTVPLPNAHPSPYSEMDYQNNGQPVIVECIDISLQDLCGRRGVVQQVLPFADHVEADIDFGHHIIRLTEKQYKIIPQQ